MSELFKPMHEDEKLHPGFKTMLSSHISRPAMQMMEDVFSRFKDSDGNFVEQFQSFGFDARVFELFLFAMFEESGHAIDRSYQFPDFVLSRDGVTAWVEATIAGQQPTGKIEPYYPIPDERDEHAQAAYIEHEAVIRIASPIYKKMNRKVKYWEMPHVLNKSFVIAVQDFSKAGSLMVSSSTIAHYLFGLKGDWYHDKDGNLVIINKPIEEHGLGLKKIPSGLFAQEGSEYLSGVLFCNTGTYAKFNRMGQQGKYRNPNMRMLRYGTCHRHDPNATKPSPFLMEVGNPEEGFETWREGTVLIRNPNAKHPLPPEWLGAGAEDEYEGGQIITTFSESFLPFWSMTENFDARIPSFIIEHRARRIEKALLQEFPL